MRLEQFTYYNYYLSYLSKIQGYTKRQSLYKGVSQDTKQWNAKTWPVQLQPQKWNTILLLVTDDTTMNTGQDEILKDWGSKQILEQCSIKNIDIIESNSLSARLH